MLIDTNINIEINKGNLGVLRKRFPGKELKIGQKIKIPTLTFKGSNREVLVQCDYCSIKLKVTIKNYVNSTKKINKYSCNNTACQISKRRELKEKGINSPQKKAKETVLERYGVENVFQTQEVKNKRKESMISRYGVEHLMQSENHLKEIQNKSKQTNLKRYGTKYPSQNKKVQQKIKQTFLKKYGSTNHTQYDTYTPKENSSLIEKSVLKYVEQITDKKVVSNYKDKKEIDIYIPELKIGIEVNGLYWHSEKFLEREYHKSKTKHFLNKRIKVVHIWEDEWINKKEIVKSQLKSFFGHTERIYARKTKVKKISNKEVREFLKENHLQGDYPRIKISYGLYDRQKELVAVMVFDKQEGRKEMAEREWNLSRFCNKLNTTVVGGASKLLKAFEREYKPERIISYADAEWSQGNVYKAIGFQKVEWTKPDYKYIVGKERQHKSRHRKPKGSLQTEKEIAQSKGLLRIYDCGKIKFEKVYKNKI